MFCRIVSAGGLPFVGSSIQALAGDGRLGPGLFKEAARVVSPRGRIVVSSATEETPLMLEETGFKILAMEPGTVVAVLA